MLKQDEICDKTMEMYLRKPFRVFWYMIRNFGSCSDIFLICRCSFPVNAKKASGAKHVIVYMGRPNLFHPCLGAYPIPLEFKMAWRASARRPGGRTRL